MPSWEDAIYNDAESVSGILSDTGTLVANLPGEALEGIQEFGVDAYNTLNSIKFAWEATPDEMSSAKQIYRIKDILNFPNNIRAISVDEIEDAVNDFSNSYLSKSNERIKNYVEKTKQTINALQVSNKLIEAYRVVKPVVKKAVNIGGLVFNFANSGEIAQDVLQFILREVQRKYKDEIERYWINFVSAPVFIVLGGDNEEAIETVLDKYIEVENAYREEINDYLMSLINNLEDFLTLVRKLNDYLVNKGSEFYTKNFVPMANSIINDLCLFDEWTYISVKDDKIIRIKESDEEDVLLNTDAINIFKNSTKLYFTTYNETLDETYLHEIADPFTVINTLSGKSKAIYEIFSKIVVITNKEIADETTSYFTYTADEISSSNIIDGYLYFSIGNKLLHFESLPSSEIEDTTVNGIITSIVKYNDSICLGSVFNGEIEVSSYMLQPEFTEAISDLKEFTYLKEIDGIYYGVKDKKLYTIVKDSLDHEITSTLLCDNIESEVNGIEIINISGTDYYIIASGATLLVSDGEFNNWDEKVIDFEEIGIETAVITDLTHISGDGLYLSSYKNVVKIDYADFPNLIPTTTIPTTISLDGAYTVVSEEPERLEIPEEIDSISISLIKTYDYLVYKIHSITPLIVSAGKYIYSGDTVLLESDRNIYLSIIDGSDYYYTKGSNLWYNDIVLSSINTDNTILSMVKYGSNIILFTKENYYVSTGNSSFNYFIPKSFSIKGTICNLVSDGEALLVGSDSDIYQYSKSELGIYEYIQKIKNMLFVKKIDNEVYIQTSDNMLYRNSKYNIVYKDATYHNGYEHNSFYIKKLGIAPFDYCSKALENKNIQKKDYIEILKPDFMSYFGELVSILPNFISMQIIENLEKINISSLSTVPSETQKNILNTIKKEIQDKVVSLLRQVMAETFSINIDQEEEFAEELYNRLILPGRNNITQEFYGLAFSTIGDMIQETFNIFNGLDIYGLVIAYYNRHKAELADDMIKEVNKRFVSLEEYKFALDTVRGTEMNCYSEQNFLLNYYVKEDINTIIDGKTGAITESDKNSLFSILPSKDNILIEEVGNYAEWEFQIKDIINTIYKPTQQIYFEDAVKEQDMNPIQWEELPENIDKDEFSRLLNIIIEERKNAILVAINLLVGSGAVPCYSCITDESALIEVRNKINGILLLMKSSAQKKIKKSTLYENVPTSFTVYDSFGAYLYLPKVLERQSKLYAKYLGQLIDIIINEDEELV